MDSVRIGNGCGFWGDNVDAPFLLARDGRLDYLTLEYLAELTMSILARQKQRDPQAGFATDFLDVLQRLGPLLKHQPGLKVITNAGGMNPAACAQKAREILDAAGLADRAVATVAGHLIECGAQCTGGLWCNWQEAPDLADVGYPIAEVEPSGTFRITKPPGSGGAVNSETVAEQLLYEVGDPAAYLTPDVTADFTSVRLSETGPDVVRVEGARGKPATDSYKVSIAYRDGWTASGTLVICAGAGVD